MREFSNTKSRKLADAGLYFCSPCGCHYTDGCAEHNLKEQTHVSAPKKDKK